MVHFPFPSNNGSIVTEDTKLPSDLNKFISEDKTVQTDGSRKKQRKKGEGRVEPVPCDLGGSRKPSPQDAERRHEGPHRHATV